MTQLTTVKLFAPLPPGEFAKKPQYHGPWRVATEIAGLIDVALLVIAADTSAGAQPTGPQQSLMRQMTTMDVYKDPMDSRGRQKNVALLVGGASHIPAKKVLDILDQQITAKDFSRPSPALMAIAPLKKGQTGQDWQGPGKGYKPSKPVPEDVGKALEKAKETEESAGPKKAGMSAVVIIGLCAAAALAFVYLKPKGKS